MVTDTIDEMIDEMTEVVMVEDEKIAMENLLSTETKVHPEELTTESLSEDYQKVEAGKT